MSFEIGSEVGLNRLEHTLEQMEADLPNLTLEKDGEKIEQSIKDLAWGAENLRQAQRSANWSQRRRLGKIIQRTHQQLDRLEDIKSPKVHSNVSLWCLLCCMSCCCR